MHVLWMLIGLGCSGGCGAKPVTPEAMPADGAKSATMPSAASACAATTDDLEKAMRATLQASTESEAWNGWEAATGVWTAVADTPPITAPYRPAAFWVELSITPAGVIGLDGVQAPGLSDRAGFCGAVKQAVKAKSMAGTPATLLVRAHHEAGGKAVADVLQALPGCDVREVSLIFRQADVPELRRADPPTKLASVVADLRARGARQELFPTAKEGGVLAESYTSCPYDTRSVAQARRTERPAVLAAALLAGYKQCGCKADADLLLWHVQAVALPDTFARTLPVNLSSQAKAVPVRPADDWGTVAARFADVAAKAGGDAPVALWFAPAPDGEEPAAWSPAGVP